MGEKSCFESFGPKVHKLGLKWGFSEFYENWQAEFLWFLHEVTVVRGFNIDLIELFSENVVFSSFGLERGGMEPKWDFPSFMKNWLFRIFA